MCLVFSLLVSDFCICLSTLFVVICLSCIGVSPLLELYWSLSLESICVLNYFIKSFSKCWITGAEVVADIADFLTFQAQCT
uniref:Uncharacterized protein n=1 Tax=Salix viminalis TaxID=40686 RepID=A0A6N2LSI0_SALVM